MASIEEQLPEMPADEAEIEALLAAQRRDYSGMLTERDCTVERPRGRYSFCSHAGRKALHTPFASQGRTTTLPRRPR